MADEHDPAPTPVPPPHPPGWDASDSLLEARLEADEQLIAKEEKAIRMTGWVVGFLAVALVGAIAALAVGIAALNRDIDAVAQATPKDGSVGTAALQDASVTADKLAAGSVGTAAIADGAVAGQDLAAGSVGTSALAPDAVTRQAIAASAVAGAQIADRAVAGKKVARDSLTGNHIKERTLGSVPAAKTAAEAATAEDADALGGRSATAYLAAVRLVEATTAADSDPSKDVTAVCPSGTRVIAGGAALAGALRGVAIVASTPIAGGWLAVAAARPGDHDPWQLEATAVCAVGGER